MPAGRRKGGGAVHPRGLLFRRAEEPLIFLFFGMGLPFSTREKVGRRDRPDPRG